MVLSWLCVSGIFMVVVVPSITVLVIGKALPLGTAAFFNIQ